MMTTTKTLQHFKNKLVLVSHWPLTRVQHQASWVGDVFTDQHGAMSAVKFGHFNGLQNVVSPIQVPTHPVYSKALCYSYATVEYLSEGESFWVKGWSPVIPCSNRSPKIEVLVHELQLPTALKMECLANPFFLHLTEANLILVVLEHRI